MKIFIVGRLHQPLSAPLRKASLGTWGRGEPRASSQCYQRKDKPRSLSGGARDRLNDRMRVPISQIGHSAVPFGVDFGELGSLPSRVRYESNPAPSANPWSA